MLFKEITSFIFEMIFIFNPLINIPTVLALTSNQDSCQRQKTINLALGVASATIIMFSICGNFLIDILDIPVAAMHFTGAVLIGNAALQMITQAGATSTAESANIAIYPIAIPLFAGPGTISLVLTKLKEALTLQDKAIIFILILISLLLSYTILSIGVRCLTNLPMVYIQTLSCLFGMILMMITMKIFIKGICDLVNIVLASIKY